MRINENIEIEEWERYFRGLLGGMKSRVIWRDRGDRRREEERDLGKEEIKKVIRRLKDGKVMGVDNVLNEVWKYGGQEVEDWVWEVCNGVWKGEGWPEVWKEGIVVPI